MADYSGHGLLGPAAVVNQAAGLLHFPDLLMQGLLANMRPGGSPLAASRFTTTPDPRGGEYITLRSVPRGIASYVPRRGKLESYYDPKHAVIGQDEFRTFITPKGHVQHDVPAAAHPGLIYRGMSAEEFAHFLQTGRVMSNQSYNLGGQEGLTYFSNDPQSARAYASGFAPWEKTATFTHPAYVVAAKKPPQSQIKDVRGVGTDEVGVMGGVPREDVVGAYRGDVYGFDPGWRMGGSRTSPSSRLTWKQLFGLE